MAKAQLDSESDLSNIEEESYMDYLEDPSDPDSDIEVKESDPSQDPSTIKTVNIDIEHGAT
ncbi:Hypothetical predicted protein, partial [Pelobates cultripes]